LWIEYEGENEGENGLGTLSLAMMLIRLISVLFLVGGALSGCSVSPGSVAPQFKAMTWNILHGGRDDGEIVGPRRVVEIIRDSGVDLVAMQETYGSGEMIASELDFHFHPRGTNVSIFSRHPIIEDVSVFEEFKCVGAVIELPDKSKIAFNSIWLPYDKEIWEEGTRDGLTPPEMLAACESSSTDLKQILEQIEARLAESGYADLPVIIAGDFNSMSHLDYTEAAKDQYGYVIDWPTSRVISDAGYRDAYREKHPGVDRQRDRTWTPRFPEQQQDRIDFIYYKGGGLHVSAVEIIDAHPEKFPSDHAALVAIFGKGQ
jgi:endonuclease/exonuclease/phosphatase family metal-dependent hydrolase